MALRLNAKEGPNDAADDAIEAAMTSLLAARAPGATICPSEVARALVPDDEAAWRAAMPAVRRVAAALARRGRVRVTRGGIEVDAESAGGPIRLGTPARGGPAADE